MKRRPILVRLVTPFGTPAWMDEAEALRHVEADDARWLRWSELGILSDAQRAVGPPRIERVR